MNMIEIQRKFWVTGDLHGELARLSRAAIPYERLTFWDYIIVAGDFGMVFHHNDLRDQAKLDWIEAHLPCQLLFVDGNHEDHPALAGFPVVDYFGGKAHRLRSNVYHLMRGEIYDVDGFKIFAFGGGYSIDKHLRIPGVDWWPEEMPSDDEYENALKNLEKHNYFVDLVVTHVPPVETLQAMHQMRLISGIDPHEVRLNIFLETVRENTTYQLWVFGHMHLDRRMWRNQRAAYYDILDARTGEEV